jgi:hypothetical protein
MMGWVALAAWLLFGDTAEYIPASAEIFGGDGHKSSAGVKIPLKTFMRKILCKEITHPCRRYPI